MIKDGWYYCTCGQKVFKVLSTTRLVDFPCFCKKCKTENLIQIHNGGEVYKYELKGIHDIGRGEVKITRTNIKTK